MVSTALMNGISARTGDVQATLGGIRATDSPPCNRLPSCTCNTCANARQQLIDHPKPAAPIPRPPRVPAPRLEICDIRLIMIFIYIFYTLIGYTPIPEGSPLLLAPPVLNIYGAPACRDAPRARSSPSRSPASGLEIPISPSPIGRDTLRNADPSPSPPVFIAENVGS